MIRTWLVGVCLEVKDRPGLSDQVQAKSLNTDTED